jgi:putative addiction module CopG family antidote
VNGTTIWHQSKKPGTISQTHQDTTMTVKSLPLTASQKRFISSEIKAGRYQDEQEMLLAGLTLLERQKKYEELVAMVQEGLDDVGQGRVAKLSAIEAVKRHGQILRERSARASRQRLGKKHETLREMIQKGLDQLDAGEAMVFESPREFSKHLRQSFKKAVRQVEKDQA